MIFFDFILEKINLVFWTRLRDCVTDPYKAFLLFLYRNIRLQFINGVPDQFLKSQEPPISLYHTWLETVGSIARCL